MPVSTLLKRLKRNFNPFPSFRVEEDEKPKSQQDADEAMEGSEIGNDAEEETEKKEYVKKEYYAREYVSDGVTEE